MHFILSPSSDLLHCESVVKDFVFFSSTSGGRSGGAVVSPSQEKAGRREESEGVLAGGSDYCWRKKAARFGSVSATVFGLVWVDYGGERWWC